MPQIDIRLQSSADVSGFTNTNRAAVALDQNLKNAAASATGVEGSMQRVGRSSSQVMLQAGNQVQDFVVQVAGGQKVLLALAQQGSQFLGVFGPGGAIAGAVLAIGALAIQFTQVGESIKDANDRAKELDVTFKSIRESSIAGQRANMAPKVELAWLDQQLANLKAQKEIYDAKVALAGSGMNYLTEVAGGVGKISNINIAAKPEFLEKFGLPKDTSSGGRSVYEALVKMSEEQLTKSADAAKKITDFTIEAQALRKKIEADGKKAEQEEVDRTLSLNASVRRDGLGKQELQYEDIDEAQARGAASLAQWNSEMESAAQKFKEAVAPAEEYRRKIEEIDNLERFGKLTTDQAAASRKRLASELNDTAGKAIRNAREELQKFDSALAKIAANEGLTDNEKYQERLRILKDQEAAILRLKKALEDFAAANPGLATAAIGSEIQTLGTKLNNNQADREPPPSAIKRARTGFRASQEEGFQSAGEGVEGGILGWMASVGTMADQLADGIRNTLGAAVSAITDEIINWDGTGRGALQALGNIGNAIFRAMLQQLVQMGATWLINQALVKTGLISLEATGDALRTGRIAKENAAELATLPAKSAGAAASGISSYGATIAFGLLAVALIASLAGGFADGGFTAKGARTKPAGIVHAGEWVAPQWMVNSPTVGPLIASLEGMRTGAAGYDVGGMVDALASPGYAIERARYEPSRSSDSAFSSANGDSQSLRPNMIVLFDPQQYARMMQENSRDWFFDMANEHRRKS